MLYPVIYAFPPYTYHWNTSENTPSITIASTDTTYSAGQGMALSGTTFSVANPSSLDTMTEDGASSTLTAAGADNIMVYDGSGTTWAKMSLAEVADFAISNGAGGISTFKTISVTGQDDIVADAAADTLTLTAGSGITIANTAASDTITFSVANGDISNAMLANDVFGEHVDYLTVRETVKSLNHFYEDEYYWSFLNIYI